MNSWFFPLFVVFVLLKCDAQSLKSHNWEERVLLVFTPDLEHPEYLSQRKLWSDANRNELEERRLVIYRILPHETELWRRGYIKRLKSNAFYEEYAIKPNDFAVLLIGLDGGLKMIKSQAITTEQLFGRIDSMPMRRAEIRRKKGN